MSYSSLGDRMKDYERVSATKLIRRTPVVIRLDGKAFHTYTKKADKPFDKDLSEVREVVMSYLCSNIQGCLIGYSQSDEISLILKDWDSYATDPWFDNKVQKIVSVAASMCTAMWNAEVSKRGLGSKFNGLAVFDARAFNLSREEVVNYLIWRQQDWERNSVQMLSRAHYSHKEMDGVSCQQAITKLEEEKGVIWGNLPPKQKQGEVYLEGHLYGNFVFKESRGFIKHLLDGVEAA